MSFQGGLYHRAVLHARQNIGDNLVKAHVDPRLTISSSSSSSSSSSLPSHTDDNPNPVKSANRDTPTTITSSTPATARPISTQNVSTSPQGNVVVPSTIISTSSSLFSSASSVPTAAGTTPGSLVGGVIGALAAVSAIVFMAFFILKRSRKRRNRSSGARYFDKEKLERPCIDDGPEVFPPHEKDLPSISTERGLPPIPDPFEAPQMTQTVQLPASPYGASNPFLTSPPSGSLYDSNESQHDFGAPPMPGNDGPAPYSSYTATPSKNARPNRTTPPGSPFGASYAMQNPFATPDRTLSPTTPASPAWNLPPIGAQMPLLPGGVFGSDGGRDSGYSASCSEVHVGQAYKVQVGVSMPKYEDLTKERSKSPPPPSIPCDPATTANPAELAHKTPTAVNNPVVIPLSSRPPSSQTVYNSEDAYGGM